MDNDAAVVYLDTLRRIWLLAGEIEDNITRHRPGQIHDDVFPDAELICDTAVQIIALADKLAKKPGMKVVCSNCGKVNDPNTVRLTGADGAATRDPTPRPGP